MKVYKHPSYSYVTVAKIAFSEIKRIDIDLCKQPRETIDSYYKRAYEKPAILTNAGFFNMSNGDTVFSLINDGQVVSRDNGIPTGFGILENKDITYGTIDEKPWRDFISAYPPLVVNGKRASITVGHELNYKARRTIWGFNNQYVFVVCIDAPGMAYKAMQNLALDLDMTYCINLDGGGSTRMLYNGKRQTANVYNRPVDNLLAIYVNQEEPKEPEKKTFYRVQVGAYKSPKNAQNMLSTIVNLKDTIQAGYKSAYVREVNGLYKVQIGYFSVQANAQKVVNDLKSKGIQAFITVEEKK